MNESPFPLFGEVASLLAAFAWACSLIFYRTWGIGISPVAINLLKNTVALVGLGAIVVFFQRPFPSDTSLWITLALSGVLGVAVSDTFLFAGLKRIGTTLTAASFCASPPMAALIAYFVLGETLRLAEVTGIAIALSATAATVLVNRQPREGRTALDDRNWWIGVLYLFLCQFTNAIAIVLGRSALSQVDVVTGTVLRIYPAMLALLPIFLLQRRASFERWRLPRRGQIAGLLGGAIIGTFIGLLLMSAGLKYTRAGIASALNATYPVWALPLAHWFLGEKLKSVTAAWVLVAVAGVVLLMLG